MWSERRVFVTGAEGFLGSWVVAELKAAGATVVGLVRDRHRDRRWPEAESVVPDVVVAGDLCDYETVLRGIGEHECDTVFHLGAQPLVTVAARHPRSTFESNIRGTWHVLEACRELRGLVQRIVVASSDKAYGVSDRLPYEEEMPLNGLHPYDASKVCTDVIARSYHFTFGMPVCVVRAGNFYGGGDFAWSRIVPGTIRSVLFGERPVLRSDGSPVRDYVYVRDIARAYLRLAEAMADPALHGQAFNFGTETPVSVLDLVGRILRLAGRPELQPLVRAEAKAEIPAQVLGCAKARRVLGWRPEWSLEEGLSETLRWYAAWFGRPVPRSAATAAVSGPA